MKSAPFIFLFLSLLLSELNVSACTTFIISGKITPDGKPILFKHRDTDIMDNSLVFFSDGKYDYIGLVTGDKNWDRMVWGGYNSTGFAIMNSAAYNNNSGDTTRFMDQEGVVMKLALQSCRTIADFERMLDSLPKPLGVDANFGVIDAYGGAAYYETGNYRYVKYDVNDPATAPDGFLIRTNHSMSGNLKEGYGFNRYNIAMKAMGEAIASGSLTPAYLINSFSRNLTHALTKIDMKENLPDGDGSDFRFFIDFIPRYISASSIMVVGAGEPKQAKDVVMYSVLGFPLTSIAVPVFIEGGSTLPGVVTMGENLHSPLCDAALSMKDKCFQNTNDGGKNYIDLSLLINAKDNGFMQLLNPIEKEVFEKSDELIAGINTGKKGKREIQSFYKWLDEYLAEAYQDKVGIKLFE